MIWSGYPGHWWEFAFCCHLLVLWVTQSGLMVYPMPWSLCFSTGAQRHERATVTTTVPPADALEGGAEQAA